MVTAAHACNRCIIYYKIPITGREFVCRMGGAAAGATWAMPPQILVGATMYLAPPIIGLYIR